MYPDDLYTYFAHFLSRSLHNQKGDNSLLIYGICYAAGNIFRHFTQLAQSQIDLIKFFLQEFPKI